MYAQCGQLHSRDSDVRNKKMGTEIFQQFGNNSEEISVRYMS